MNSEKQLQEIAATHLGKVGGAGYSDQYDPTLLVAIPRHLNRESYGIEEGNLPFTGVDVWNAYEVSTLTANGYPVTGVLKIVYSCQSQYHVESKSLKLYLNSFNMTKSPETSISATKEWVKGKVKEDLKNCLGVDVEVSILTEADIVEGEGFLYSLSDIYKYPMFEHLVDVSTLDFQPSDKGFEFLKTALSNPEQKYTFKLQFDGFRSNCRVTNQPDFATIHIYLKGNCLPDTGSVGQYLVSHRKVNHFHEEIVEAIYLDLSKKYSPEELLVVGTFSRRGGIDICPVRASSEDLLPTGFVDSRTYHYKTLKQ